MGIRVITSGITNIHHGREGHFPGVCKLHIIAEADSHPPIYRRFQAAEIQHKLVAAEGQGPAEYGGFQMSTSITINIEDDYIYSGTISRDNYFRRCETDNGLFLFGRENVFCMLDAYEVYN